MEGGALVECVSPANRGLAYGDGLFETMRVQAGNIPLLQRHWQRLTTDLQRLSIPAPGIELLAFLSECCRGISSGVLKLIVTRGEGGRGYLPAETAEPVIVVSLHALPHYEVDFALSGIAIGLARLRLGHSAMLAGLKHLNRLEQVLVRQDLHRMGHLEGVVLDQDDFVVEAAFSNIFMVSENCLQTPALDRAGVAGVMRGWIVESAPSLGLSVTECRLTLPELLKADEVFLCNSVNGLWPVIAIENQAFNIGSCTRALQNEFARQLV